MCNLHDIEVVDQISENIYMQYFLGYPSFTNETPFDASLFVEFRKRLGMENLNAINEKIIALKTKIETKQNIDNQQTVLTNDENPDDSQSSDPIEIEHKGRVIFDATAYP